MVNESIANYNTEAVVFMGIKSANLRVRTPVLQEK